MNMAEIIVDIGSDGEVQIEGKGFKGRTCDTAMGAFEKALGVVRIRQNKPEYFRSEVKDHGQVKTR
jgi:hypothetical protein